MAVSYHCELKAHAKTKNGNNIDTKLHYDYIMGEGNYQTYKENNRKVIYKQTYNLPKWAKNNASIYWEQAERYRTRDNCAYTKGRQPRAYREFILTLQMILTLEENIKCIEEFLKVLEIEHDFVYSIAIHKEPARWDNDLINLHCHIMIDERKIEHDREIESAEQYFKKNVKKKDGTKVGGYKRDRRLKKKDFLEKARLYWAEIVNKKLEQNGFKERITHLSLKAQAKELKQKGKIKEAEAMRKKTAPKMFNLSNKKYKGKIIEKIKFYKSGGVDKIPITEMKPTKKKISLFAKDYIQRQIEREQNKE